MLETTSVKLDIWSKAALKPLKSRFITKHVRHVFLTSWDWQPASKISRAFSSTSAYDEFGQREK